MPNDARQTHLKVLPVTKPVPIEQELEVFSIEHGVERFFLRSTELP